MDYYSEIKSKLLDNEMYSRVKDYSKERHKVITYFEVGKLLSLAGKHYGEGIIKEYSCKLTGEIGKGYSVRNLYNMKLLFLKVQTLSAKLTWSHYSLIVSFEKNKMNYYIRLCEEQNLDVRSLKSKIKSNEYERLPENSKGKLMGVRRLNVDDLIKNPIIIKNNVNNEIFSEKILQKLILEDIPSFLKELGNGFTFVDNEYKIKLGDRYNYIDLLLYNIEFNCYVVVELKVTELKKEHIGQIEVYMNYIDRKVRSINQDKTIGIIICKKDNKFIMEYCSDPRICRTTYELVS